MTNKEVYEGGDQTELWNYKYASIGNLERVDKFVADENGALMPAFRIEYLIGGMNRRVGRIKKSEYNAETYEFEITDKKGWLYDGGLNPIAEISVNDNDEPFISARYTYGTKSNVPDYIERWVEVTSQYKTYRVATNHLGSPVTVIDVAEGEIAQQIRYDEFGFITDGGDSSPGFQPFGFAGGLYDHETGLIRFGARDYDPQIGRWTAKDPILFSGGNTNLYGYALNDPVGFFDINGLWEVEVSLNTSLFLEDRSATFAVFGNEGRIGFFSGDKVNTSKGVSTTAIGFGVTFAISGLVEFSQDVKDFLSIERRDGGTDDITISKGIFSKYTGLGVTPGKDILNINAGLGFGLSTIPFFPDFGVCFND